VRKIEGHPVSIYEARKSLPIVERPFPLGARGLWPGPFASIYFFIILSRDPLNVVFLILKESPSLFKIDEIRKEPNQNADGKHDKHITYAFG